MADLVAGGAFLENPAAAGRAGVNFFLFFLSGRNDDPVDGPTGPEKETPGADPDGVFADGAEESFVGFPVLPGQGGVSGESDRPDEMHQEFYNDGD